MDRRVLIVDDDDRLRDVLSLCIDLEEGLEVAGTAGNAAEATRLAFALHPDVIVLDYHMPDVDGIEAIPQLRHAAPDVRIVMFSADDDDAASATALARGAIAFVTKSGQDGLDEVVRLARAS